MRFAVLLMLAVGFISACKEQPKNEIYNENNTTVIDGVVYDIDEHPISGLYKTYYSNGNVKMEVYSKNGKPNGLGKFYSKEGYLTYEGTFNDGVPVGTMYQYYRNGKVHNEMNYANGVWHGVQQTFDKDGELSAEVIYEKGVPISGFVIIDGQTAEFTPEELAKIAQ